MSRPGGKVVILGGGMAGLSAAWRLSEPGWRDRFDSITVYQRGWRLGGKAASSRGEHGRIEEHGLHVWLGSYENAFGLLRECYAELDRAATDPAAPITAWDQALIPSDTVGVTDRFDGGWLPWLGVFSGNAGLPGDPDGTGRELTVVEFLGRAVRLLTDFTESLSGAPPSERPPRSDRLDRRRAALLVALLTAVIRGIVADNLITDPRGFRAINDEDFIEWLRRHGAPPDVGDFALVRGLYDLVFGYADADPGRPAFGAGLMVFMTGLVLFGYRGAVFWKMTAGMGDVVIAPLYQALRRRGVDFEFFHRLDGLHLDDRHLAIGAITLGRQLHLADPGARYRPLTRVRGLPVFPSTPLTGQLAAPGRVPVGGWHALETYWAQPADVETRVLRRGVDFDHVVLAVSAGMLPVVAGELIADCPDWQAMTSTIRTVATQALQLWLRPAEPELGWAQPGVTISGYLPPFETWASMPQTLWAEDWPDHDRPGTVAYFCGPLNAPWPTAEVGPGYLRRHRRQVHRRAVGHLNEQLAMFFPAAVGERGFDWRLLTGAGDACGAAALRTQHLSVNVDPSDRYVQSIPGTDRYRLRPDESGYDNLVLAGDWTDSGINAGCIEAAVLSGLQAANALLGRHRHHRIRGFYLP